MPSAIIHEKDNVAANSYASLFEADSYMEDMYDDGGWSSIDDEQKMRLLLTATKMIDKLNVVFDRVIPERKLKFPVKGIQVDGYDLAKEACILQALYLYKYDSQLDYAMRNTITGITNEAYSETSVNRKPSFNSMKRYSSEVYKILADYISLSVTISRG